MKDEFQVQVAGGGIAMNHSLFYAADGLDGAVDQVFAGGGKDYNPDIVGNQFFFDQAADEFKFLV